jgi:hypothetical protein
MAEFVGKGPCLFEKGHCSARVNFLYHPGREGSEPKDTYRKWMPGNSFEASLEPGPTRRPSQPAVGKRHRQPEASLRLVQRVGPFESGAEVVVLGPDVLKPTACIPPGAQVALQLLELGPPADERAERHGEVMAVGVEERKARKSNRELCVSDLEEVFRTARIGQAMFAKVAEAEVGREIVDSEFPGGE